MLHLFLVKVTSWVHFSLNITRYELSTSQKPKYYTLPRYVHTLVYSCFDKGSRKKDKSVRDNADWCYGW